MPEGVPQPYIEYSGSTGGRGVCYTPVMDRPQFERLVRQALGEIPDGLSAFISNVDIVVEDWPTWDQLGGHVIGEGEVLLGLYEGIPLTERSDYGMVLPDRITLFQKAIESVCASHAEVVKEIKKTVVHEVAHHFGIDDHRLSELGA